LNDSFQSEGNKTPTPPKENILINEIIADYLAFNGYFNTLSVLAAESGTPSLVEVHENGSDSTMLGSNFIRAELGLSKGNIISGRRRTPLALLYEIIETLKTINRSRAKTS
jgi:lisH domain-containing protein FOPNL